MTFPKCKWEFTSLSLEERPWEFPGPSCEREELLPGGKRHRRDLHLRERAVSVWVRSRGERGASHTAAGRQKVGL